MRLVLTERQRDGRRGLRDIIVPDSKDPMTDPAFRRVLGITPQGERAVKDWLAKHPEHDPLLQALAEREKLIASHPVGRDVLAAERKA